MNTTTTYKVIENQKGKYRTGVGSVFNESMWTKNINEAILFREDTHNNTFKKILSDILNFEKVHCEVRVIVKKETFIIGNVINLHDNTNID